MAEPAAKSPSPLDPLKPLDGPELFFGLVGPIGTDLNLVNELLKNELTKFNYQFHVIKQSSLLGLIERDTLFAQSLKTLDTLIILKRVRNFAKKRGAETLSRYSLSLQYGAFGKTTAEMRIHR